MANATVGMNGSMHDGFETPTRERSNSNGSVTSTASAMISSPSFMAALPIAPKPVHEWVKDSERSRCKRCNVSFGLTVRKHHCRLCGDIFCGACTKDRVRFKSFRVCPECYASVQTKTTGRDMAREFDARRSERAALHHQQMLSAINPVNPPPDLDSLNDLPVIPLQQLGRPARVEGQSNGVEKRNGNIRRRRARSSSAKNTPRINGQTGAHLVPSIDISPKPKFSCVRCLFGTIGALMATAALLVFIVWASSHDLNQFPKLNELAKTIGLPAGAHVPLWAMCVAVFIILVVITLLCSALCTESRAPVLAQSVTQTKSISNSVNEDDEEEDDEEGEEVKNYISEDDDDGVDAAANTPATATAAALSSPSQNGHLITAAATSPAQLQATR